MPEHGFKSHPVVALCWFPLLRELYDPIGVASSIGTCEGRQRRYQAESHQPAANVTKQTQSFIATGHGDVGLLVIAAESSESCTAGLNLLRLISVEKVA